MDSIWNEVFRAVGILIGAGLIALVYIIAKSVTADSRKSLYMCLLIGLLSCAALGLINAANVGSPTCLDSETDNYGTVCNEYDDDGYEPSFEERAGVFAFWVTVSIAPIGFGINAGHNEREMKKKNKTATNR
jgi:hypothetical protein